MSPRDRSPAPSEPPPSGPRAPACDELRIAPAAGPPDADRRARLVQALADLLLADLTRYPPGAP